MGKLFEVNSLEDMGDLMCNGLDEPDCELPKEQDNDCNGEDDVR